MGVGGRTISEAKRNLTLYEVHIWRQYRARGLLVGARTHERAAAVVARAMRGGEINEYLPMRPEYESAPTPKQGVSVTQAMAILGGTVKKRR